MATLCSKPALALIVSFILIRLLFIFTVPMVEAELTAVGGFHGPYLRLSMPRDVESIVNASHSRHTLATCDGVH